MTNHQFENETIKRILDIVSSKLHGKRAEYNPDLEDRFKSFRRSGIRHGKTELQVAKDDQDKHTDVIEAWIESDEIPMDDDLYLVTEKITDRIAYDIMIYAMIEDRKNGSQNRE